MPMKKGPQGGGSNSDGNKNMEYCSLCYDNEKFAQPAFTVQDMQKSCIEIITECGNPEFIAWACTRRVPGLNCWSAQ
jgi:hypothetical protein